MDRDGAGAGPAVEALRGLDVRAFEAWLRRERPDLAGPAGGGPLSAQLLTGGRSNLTYRVDGGARPLVLRRPPLAHVQATAHDMGREFTVQRALAASPVPVPAVHVLCEDPGAPTGVGAPFYVMDHVPGRVLASPADDADLDHAQRRALGLELVGHLAALHDLVPADLGLAGFGRPDGFLGRQLRRWATQLAGSRSRDLPELDAAAAELAERVPTTSSTGLVHGDFRLDNALVDVGAPGVGGAPARPPRVAAVLDWEMATLGDTATDLGTLGVYWQLGELARGAGLAATSAVLPGAGYPGFAELTSAYRIARSGREVIADLPWYVALGAVKLAVILEGVHFRWRGGGTVGEGFDGIGDLVEPLARAARRCLATGTTSLTGT